MSPAEAAAFLRRYNEWRRTDDRYGMPYPDPRVIGEAIDAAIEMIERLEAAEKDIARKEKVIDALGSGLNAVAKERDELRAKIAEMEQQAPARLVTATAYRWRYRGAVMWQYGELTEETARLAKEHNHEVQPLYALPGAKGE